MNRTIEGSRHCLGADRRFYYKSHDQFRQHLADFIATHNFTCHLET